jgi:hypothetical protein
VEQDAEPVVVEPSEAVPGAFDLLHAQVQSFGRPVGGAGGLAGEDLGSLWREGVAQRSDLGDLVGAAARDRLVQQHRCVGVVVGQVDISNTFLSDNQRFATRTT